MTGSSLQPKIMESEYEIEAGTQESILTTR